MNCTSISASLTRYQPPAPAKKFEDTAAANAALLAASLDQSAHYGGHRSIPPASPAAATTQTSASTLDLIA